MNHQTGAGIGHIKPFPHPCRKDNRKLQSLTFVDAHDPHRIFLFSTDIDLTKIHLIFLQLFHIPDKIKQPTVTGALIFHGFFHQHLQICLPLCTAGHRTCV